MFAMDDMASYNWTAGDGVAESGFADNRVTDNVGAASSLSPTTVSWEIGSQMRGTADNMATYNVVTNDSVVDDVLTDSIVDDDVHDGVVATLSLPMTIGQCGLA